MPLVFVIGEDWTLRGAVRAELRERGVEALGFANLNDALEAMAAGSPPSVIVLDAACADTGDTLWGVLARRSAVLVVASRFEAPPHMEGMRIMFRPVGVGDIVRQVEQLLAG
ncbi:MAG TPA: hypothetical protein VGA40_02555, partial [Candidatus Acidoferrales bacterium]